jgi:hypothetical protein
MWEGTERNGSMGEGQGLLAPGGGMPARAVHQRDRQRVVQGVRALQDVRWDLMTTSRDVSLELQPANTLMAQPSPPPSTAVPEFGPHAPLSPAQLDTFGQSFTPAVIRGLACDWSALQNWGLGHRDAHLRALAGDACVSVMHSASNQFHGDLRRHCPQPARFADVLDSAHGDTQAKHLYLAQEPLWTSQRAECPLAPLLADVPALPPPLLAGQQLSSVNIWLSPQGSNSSAHYDPHHNLLVVIAGAKRVCLWSPAHTGAMQPMVRAVCDLRKSRR